MHQLQPVCISCSCSYSWRSAGAGSPDAASQGHTHLTTLML